jgi:hypothetical protein
MAITEESVKLLIEAEDRSRDAFDQAKKRTEDLKKAETDLWKEVARAQNDATVSGTKWEATRKQAMDTGEKLQRAYNSQAAALKQLSSAHDAAAAAVAKLGQQTQGAFTGASAAILQYIKHFVAVTAIIETARRAMNEFANTERGMNRIALETGETAKHVEHLGHQFTRLSALTGRSMEELQSGFRSFRDQAGTSLKETEELFEAVTVAAHAAGVQSEALGKVAIVTMRDLKIPMSEMTSYLDTLVKNVPSSMIASWSQVAPQITDMMRDMGFTGKENAELLTLQFTHLSQSLGSTERATQGMVNILSKMKDVGTNLGKMMVPEIERIQKAGGNEGDALEKMYERLQKLGAEDPSLTKRSMVQKMVGLTPQDMQALKEAVERTRMLKEIARETGENVNTVAKRLGLLGTDSKASLDSVNASFHKMLEQIGKLLSVLGLPNALSQLMDSTATDLENIVSMLKWIGDHIPGFMGTTKPGAKPGDPATSTPKGIIDILRGKTQAEKDEEAAQKRAEDAKRRYDERNKGRPQPSSAPRPGFGPDGRRLPGYATGGEFEVPGRAGGGDKEQVQFMASPGEQVAVTTPLQESLQQQQDKADQASREHFARFHQTAFTKSGRAPWWPEGGVRATGPAGGGGGGTPGSGGGSSGGTSGGDNKSGNDPPNTSTSQPFDPRTGYDPRFPGNAPAGQTPSLIGPFGKVMPAWGAEATDPGGVYWGGGAGGGAAGGVPGLAGGPSGRALTPEERKAQADRGGDGGATGTGQAGTGDPKMRGSSAGIRGDLYNVIKEASKSLPEGYYAQILSGKEARPRGGEHPKGNAGDVKIYGPDGKPVGGDGGWYQNAKTFRLYEQFAQNAKAAEQKLYPGSNQFQWGGYFANGYGGKGKMPYGTADLMHMQWGGPAGGGNWKQGATGPIRQWLNDNGGVSQGMGADMKAPGQLVVGPGGIITGGGTPVAPGGSNPQTTVTASQDVVKAAADAAASPSTRAATATAAGKSMSQDDVRAIMTKEVVDSGLVGKVPADGAAYGIKTGSKEEWANFFTHLTYKESSYNPRTRNEKDQGGSYGLLQVSHLDNKRYGLGLDKGNTPEELLDPTTGAKVGVRLAAKRILDQKYGQGINISKMAPSWSPIRNKLLYNKTPALPSNVKNSDPKSDAKPADNKPATAPTNATSSPVQGAPGGPSGRSLTKEERAAGHATIAEGKAEGGDVTAGKPYVVGERGPELMVPGQSGVVHPGTGKTGPGTEFPEGMDPSAVGLQPGGVGPFGSDLDAALGFVPGGPITSAGKTLGGVAIGALGRIGGKFLGGQVEHGITKTGINATKSVLESHQEAEDKISAARAGMVPDLEPLRRMRSELEKPIVPKIEMPHAGPIRQRMSKRVEGQRERDVGMMTRHASHSDIGFS